MSSQSSILWQRLDVPGHELATLRAFDDGWQLSGTALVAHDGRPCQLGYRIACDAAWETRMVRIRGRLGSRLMELDVSCNAEHQWRADGKHLPMLDGCIDVDLAFSPSTNMLPIRRLALAVGDRAIVRAALVRFPELALEVLEQEYTRTGVDRYAYESGGGTFRRELVVNDEGFVLDYPGLWRAEASVRAPGP